MSKELKYWLNRLHLGDCVEVMKEIPSGSVDCVVTDPPYGLEFMGKDWDQALPPKEAFKEMNRVLKAGGLAFVMSSPRQDLLWRMLKLLEESGFELRQSFISWIYKTGFPKAYDVAKGIEGREQLGTANWSDWDKLDGKGELKEHLGYTRTQYEQGYRPKDYTDKKRPAKIILKSRLARKWQGWKNIKGLKPALECILMVNKPLSEDTIVDNVLKHGTGAINVNACRIPAERDLSKDYKSVRKSDDEMGERVGKFGFRQGKDSVCKPPKGIDKGRFPANLLISDDAIPSATKYFNLDKWAEHHGFLDVKKPSKKERDKGLESNSSGSVYNRKCKKCGKWERAQGIDPVKYTCTCEEPEWIEPKGNIHPTVKPIKLMAYLIELGCQPDGVVLDPFVGSGTTCIAAKQLEREWIGIEINREYLGIAQARIGNCEVVEFEPEQEEKEEKEVEKVDWKEVFRR